MGSSSSTEDLPPGTEIAGFRIERVRGRGPRAIVYEATQVDLDRPAALKVLRAGVLTDERLRALRWPDHPNAVRLYAAGTSEHGSFLALQLVDAPTLAEVRGPVPASVFRDVESVLATAHDSGQVHGAVAARNVFVERGGRGLLSDFGLGPADATPEDDRAALADLVQAFPPRSRRRIAVVALAAVAVAAGLIAVVLSTSSGADAVPPVLDGAASLGSALPVAGAQSVDCEARAPSGASQSCTIAQTTLAGKPVTPRRSGVIKRWVVRGARGQLALEVLRRRGSAYYMVARSQYATVDDASPHVLPANLPVRRGDLVGLVVTPGAMVGIRAETGGARTVRWFGPLIYQVRPPDRAAGTGFDRELLLRVEYVPGAAWRFPGELTGSAAAAAPPGRVAGRLVLRRGADRAAVVVVRVGDKVVVDLVVSGRRLVRLPIEDARPEGRLDEVSRQILRFAKPIVRVVWRNPDAVVAHEYVAGARSLTPLG